MQGSYGSRVAPERRGWLHFYLLLSAIVLVGMLASLGLYHRSLRSYQIALEALTEMGAKQNWLTDVRLTTIELNAPGNDVFESRRVEREQARFVAIEARLKELVRNKPADEPALDDFIVSVDRMAAEERGIFALLATATAGANGAASQHALEQAGVRMAAMDRHQADAQQALALIERNFREQQQRLLRSYEAELRRSVVAERYLFMIVAVVLGGIFWFGRTLQSANERVTAASRRAQEERQARFAAIGEVCASVAHGIRNPLAGISAAAQLAHEEAPDGPLRQSLSDILSEARRLDERSSRMLDFARPLEPSLSAVDLAVLLQRAATTARAAHPGVTVEVDCPAGMKAHANSDLLAECVDELLANAARAMNDSGHMRLEARRGPAEVMIRVIDAGAGISPAVQPRLFELFFTTRAGGTGVGLATVRKYMQAQGGQAELESTSPAGSIFRLRLPAPRGSNERNERAASAGFLRMR